MLLFAHIVLALLRAQLGGLEAGQASDSCSAGACGRCDNLTMRDGNVLTSCVHCGDLKGAIGTIGGSVRLPTLVIFAAIRWTKCAAKSFWEEDEIKLTQGCTVIRSPHSPHLDINAVHHRASSPEIVATERRYPSNIAASSTFRLTEWPFKPTLISTCLVLDP